MKERFKKYVCVCLMFMGILLYGNMVSAEEILIHKLQLVPDMPAVAAKINGDGSEIQSVLDKITYKGYTQPSGSILFGFHWDYSNVNLNMPGAYVLTGKPIIPEGYKLDESLSLPVFKIGVSVQETDKPDINVFQKMTAARMFYFPWLQNEDAANWQLWIKKEGGEWYDAVKSGHAVCDKTGLYIPGNALVTGNTYYMAVRGESVASRTLKFNYSAEGDIKLISYNYSEVGEEGAHHTCISSYQSDFVGGSSASFLRVFPVGTSIEKIKSFFTSKKVTLKVSTEDEFEDTAENPSILLSPEWDFSSVDTSKSGAYEVIGRFDAPEGYTIKEGLVLPVIRASISIQELRKPELNTHEIVYVYAYFPFLLDGFTEEEIKQIEAYRQINDGEFSLLTDEQYDLENNTFYFHLSGLEAGNRYGIYLTYPGGETKTFSFTYSMEQFRDIQISGRNYNDRDETELPPAQDDPINPSDDEIDDETDDETDPEDEENMDEDLLDNEYLDSYGGGYYYGGNNSGSDSSSGDSYSGEISKETEKILEELSASSVSLISGKRLADLQESNGGSVTFEKDGISLKLPGSFLDKQKIENADELQVVIQKTSDSSFSVRVFLNNTEITEIPESLVMIPLHIMDNTLIPEQLQILDVENTSVEYQYEDIQKVLKIMVDHTGDYFLRNTEAAEEEMFSDGKNGDDEIIDMEVDEADTEILTDNDGEESSKDDAAAEKNTMVDIILDFCKENWIWLGAGILAFLILWFVCSFFDKRK